MQQAQAHVEDLRLDAESRLACRGSALIRLEHLKWNKYIKRNPAKKTPDTKHVEYIKGIFKKEGCHQLQARHHVPAVVDQHQLDVALDDAQRRGRWKWKTLPSKYAIIGKQEGYPELDFPDGIECYHGRHRIQAGSEWLPPTEKWWIVDLYRSDISYELETSLMEEHDKGVKPCDGEICRKIREYKFLPGEANSQVSPITCINLEMSWWASFNASREKKFKSLLRIPMLAAGFDALGKFPGLFDAGMMVTTLHKIRATKCYEQIYCYLENIRKTWVGFFKGIEGGPQRLDMNTVKVVELRAPGISNSDAQILCGQVLGGAIFSSFSDQERVIIWENILTFKGIIPSLYKFFQDIHLLEACVGGLKWLFTVPPDQTVYTALGRCYKSQGETQLIQTTETTLETASSTDGMRLAFLQLFAVAMREHQNLPRAPVKKNLKTLPRCKADLVVLQRVAAFAKQLGFNSPEIEMLKGDLGPLPILDTQKPIPLLVTTGPGEGIKQRCGLPHTNTFEEDRKYLFLHNLCEKRDEVGEGITSFFVLKSWFTVFFDPPEWTRSVLNVESLNPPPPQIHHQYVNEEDVDMTDLGLQGSDQLEPEQQITQVQDLKRIDIGEQMQETIESAHQRMSWISKEANQRLERDQNIQPCLGELYVPRLPGTQSQDTESRDITIIRFVEQESNESGMLNPLQEHVGEALVLRVDYGDPTSVIERQVQEFLRNGKRTCDRYKKIIPARECYSVATREENKNTLFLIPDIESHGEAQEVKGQSYEVAEEGGQARVGVKDHETPQEIIQERGVEQAHDHEMTERECQVTDALQNRRILQQTQEEEEDNDLLDQEMDNATNSSILDIGTTIIYIKKRVGDSLDVSKPAEYWEWTDCVTLEVPTDDPQGVVGRRIRMFWDQDKLKPHDSNLRRLEYEDCYRAAKDDADHALYLMAPSLQTEEKAPESTSLYTKEEKAPGSTSLLNPQPLIPPGALNRSPHSIPGDKFYWQNEHDRGRLHAPPRAQEETSFGRTTHFVAPPNIPQFPPNAPQFPPPPPPPPPPHIFKFQLLPQQELIKSTAESHRDKIGRGPDREGEDQDIQNKVSMSYKENKIEIRKTPATMRITQQPSQQAYQEHKLRQFKNLRTRPKGVAKQIESFRQDCTELSAAREKLDGEQWRWREDKETLDDSSDL